MTDLKLKPTLRQSRGRFPNEMRYKHQQKRFWFAVCRLYRKKETNVKIAV